MSEEHADTLIDATQDIRDELRVIATALTNLVNAVDMLREQIASTDR